MILEASTSSDRVTAPVMKITASYCLSRGGGALSGIIFFFFTIPPQRNRGQFFQSYQIGAGRASRLKAGEKTRAYQVTAAGACNLRPLRKSHVG